MNTGSSSSTSRNLNASQLSRRSLEITATGSPLVVRQQSNMSGSPTQLYPTLSFLMEEDQSEEITHMIGIKLFKMPSQDGWTRSQEIFWLDVTATSEELPQIICNQVRQLGNVSSIGVPQELVRVEELGTKQVWMLTRKILGPSFGMDTAIINMLSSMNSEGELTSLICCDGLIVIQWLWRSRGPQQSLRRRLFG